jgi:hypothetical protein
VAAAGAGEKRGGFRRMGFQICHSRGICPLYEKGFRDKTHLERTDFYKMTKIVYLKKATGKLRFFYFCFLKINALKIFF